MILSKRMRDLRGWSQRLNSESRLTRILTSRERLRSRLRERNLNQMEKQRPKNKKGRDLKN